MAECPYVDHNSPNPEFNRSVPYSNPDGSTYVFYEHDDGYGGIINVQFCAFGFPKRDVFECLNEREWHACSHYRHADIAPEGFQKKEG